jgi:dipeptide/tripeptide permease
MNALIAPSILINAVYNQSFTEFQYQYEKMNPKNFGLITIMPEQSSNINTVMVIGLAPLFALYFYPFIGRYINFTSQRKILAGYLFVCASFFSAGILNIFVLSNENAKRNIKNEIVNCDECLNGAWQFIPFMLMSIGEVVWNITQMEYCKFIL